jgi:retron-type reverse transcriptase
MQSAEAVLGVLRERGGRGLPLDQLYRQMFNLQLYLLAYGRIYANQGAMTAGVTPETVDGMSLGKIGRIIEAMRFERYRFQPVRRTHIPKRNGKTRPLGLPTWSDKLVGEVVRLLLEAYYEPQFLRPIPRVSAPARLPHRVAGGGQHLDRNELVHRGRCLRLLRVA